MPVDIQKASLHGKPIDSDYEFTIPKFTLRDIILPKTTASALEDYIFFVKVQDQIFNDWGLVETHKFSKQFAVNLYGESGTGKTMAAHVIASELDKPLISVNYAEIESKYVGETAKNITKLFALAKEQDAILFFDEADAILSKRVTNMSSATDVSVNQTRSVLLSLMNDHEGIIIFTTNFIENYDSAFMRRILSHIKFTLPESYERKCLWEMYIPNRFPVIDLDISELVNRSKGLSGSEISNCVLKTAIKAARLEVPSVEMDYFYSSILEILSSKRDNISKNYIDKNFVDEDYVIGQIGINATKELKSA